MLVHPCRPDLHLGEEMTEEKIRENRFRRMLDRRGFSLARSRRRDPQAIDFGGYMIVDASTNTVVAGGSPFAYSMSLDDVGAWLND